MKGVNVKWNWMPFELRPNIIKKGMEMDKFCKSYLNASAKGVEQHFKPIFEKEGISFKLASIMPNTLNSHRLLHLAKTVDKQNEMAEILFRMYWTEGKDIGDVDVLVSAANELGIGDKAKEYLNSDLDVDLIKAQEKSKKVSGVPFIIINDKYEISGSQDVTRFRSIFEQIIKEYSKEEKEESSSD